MKLTRKKAIDFYVGGLLMLVLRPWVRLTGWFLRRDHDAQIQGDVAFIKMMGGGSLVIAYPSLLGLRRRYPRVKFLLVTSPSVFPYAELLHVFDRIIVIDDSSVFSILMTGFRALLHCRRLDTVIDLEVYSRLSSVFSLLTLSRNRLGFYFEDIFLRKLVYTHLIYFNRFSAIHVFYEELIYLLGASPVSTDEASDVLAGSDRVNKIRGKERKVCIGGGCSEFGRERMLTSAQWAKIISSRSGNAAERTRFIFLGGREDHALAEEITRAAKAANPSHAYENRCGELSLQDSVRELWGADEYWGIDSGLLHLARIGKIPCVSFWGPTAPFTRLQPIQGLREEVVYRPIPCSPCIHVADKPPCDGNNICIKNLLEPEKTLSSRDLLFTKWPH